MGKFENKVVIVTGAGGGIGSVTAKAFAKEGAKVAVVDFNADLAEQTVNEIKEAGGIAHNYVTNVTVFEEVSSCVKQVIADFGGVDILCNIAGGPPEARHQPLPHSH